MPTKMDYLESFELFKGMTDDEIRGVNERTRMVSYSSGHLFYMPDDEGEVLFILKSGRVQLYRMSADGRKLIVGLLSPGAIFGHMALIGQGLHDTYAQAIDDCVICIWSRDEVEQTLREKPGLALKFLDAVGRRLSQVEERLTDITFKRVPARLASLIVRLYYEHGAVPIIEGYTHQYLADMTGIYRETATQTLNIFKQQSLVALGRKRIHILDLDGLKAVAEDGEVAAGAS